MKEKNGHYKNGNGNGNGHSTVTVATFLDRSQIDYLDKFGKDCFFKFGHKISRAKILSELVDLIKDLKIDCGNIDFENETLCEGVARLLKNENIRKA